MAGRQISFIDRAACGMEQGQSRAGKGAQASGPWIVRLGPPQGGPRSQGRSRGAVGAVTAQEPARTCVSPAAGVAGYSPVGGMSRQGGAAPPAQREPASGNVGRIQETAQVGRTVRACQVGGVLPESRESGGGGLAQPGARQRAQRPSRQSPAPGQQHQTIDDAGAAFPPARYSGNSAAVSVAGWLVRSWSVRTAGAVR